MSKPRLWQPFSPTTAGQILSALPFNFPGVTLLRKGTFQTREAKEPPLSAYL